ncbi:MAG: peptidoglycan DD-metalloendopeptidase family protein [Ekhidna sp.]|uniref:peptidoglycan DD-metalloendopeptidase family protein n=1 Tax=Ekhidna sp. TaxID=2608089 RepID=UPI0032EE8D2E
MKIALILIILLPSIVFGQSEKDTYKVASYKIQSLYNSSKYDEIFELYSQEMKSALPLEKSTGFFTMLRGQMGEMEECLFVKYASGSVAIYKASFKKGILAINLSVNEIGEVNGLLMKPYVDESFPIIERNSTPLILPFKGEWTVFWGGDSREQNYHVDFTSQKGAFDLIITDKKGRSFSGNGASNEDYYAFGQELIAPCDGEIVLVVDGIKDNKPGELNPTYVPGNTVIIKTEKDEFFFFAHFKQNSIAVKQGDYVKQGDLLGLCGNSGNSSEPHLHFHLQNIEDFNKATGGKAYFEKIEVDGALKSDYSPVKGEKIKNLEE